MNFIFSSLVRFFRRENLMRAFEFAIGGRNGYVVTAIQKILTNPTIKKYFRPSFSVSYQIIEATVQKFANFSLFGKMGDEHKKTHMCIHSSKTQINYTKRLRKSDAISFLAVVYFRFGSHENQQSLEMQSGK